MYYAAVTNFHAPFLLFQQTVILHVKMEEPVHEARCADAQLNGLAHSVKNVRTSCFCSSYLLQLHCLRSLRCVHVSPSPGRCLCRDLASPPTLWRSHVSPRQALVAASCAVRAPFTEFAWDLPRIILIYYSTRILILKGTCTSACVYDVHSTLLTDILWPFPLFEFALRF